MNQKSSFSAPKNLGMKSLNWDNMAAAGTSKKAPRGFFKSKLTGRTVGTKTTNPEIAVLKTKIGAEKQLRQLSGNARQINQTLGGGCIGLHKGKPTTIQFWANGSISIKGKLSKNPLKNLA